MPSSLSFSLFSGTRNTMALAALVVAALALGAGMALARHVKTNCVPGTDFSKYKTCPWVEIEGAQRPLDGQTQAAVDEVFAGNGLTKATGDAAKQFIGYQVAINQARQWKAYRTVVTPLQSGAVWRRGLRDLLTASHYSSLLMSTTWLPRSS